MKIRPGLRVILTLFVTALMPFESAHCAWMPERPSGVAVESEHHDDGDNDDCCPQPAPSHLPTPPSDYCCCGGIDLRPAISPVSASIDAPTSVPASFAVVATIAVTANVQVVSVRLESDARSAPPPDPSTSPQSPRSPPYSA